MAADPYEIPKAHRAVVERATYIPSWYIDHRDLSLQVVDERGGDMGFTIADVLPERRWAIDGSGRLISQVEFEKRYRDWASRVTLKDGRIIPVGATNKYFDIELESVPSCDDFVDAKLDPMRPGELRFVPIRFRNDPGTGRTKIRPIYNVMGEKVTEATAVPAPAPGFAPVAVDTAVTPCGKEVAPNRLKQHMALCKACKAEAAREAPAA